MTLLGIGVVMVGMAALMAAITYSIETLRTSRSRTWWEAPAEVPETLAAHRTARLDTEAPTVSQLLRAYDPENPLDGQVFD